ncbi:glycoside hydrolase family 6 protein [Streptomyces chartreusis]|uniref:glycoside hydrolase family 6 protein n=1 Tax=Streptomyces chartreusis TaxID=1969 RepID=UPI00386FFE80
MPPAWTRWSPGTWIDACAVGIGDRPAIVIVEPDSLAQLGNLPTDAAHAERTGRVARATEVLAACPLVSGSNATWIKPDTMAERLATAKIAKVEGFAVGVANSPRDRRLVHLRPPGHTSTRIARCA